MLASELAVPSPRGSGYVRSHKILIADDSNADAEHARRTLERLPGAEITVVEDGAAALREARQTRFDLLLVDYEMPGLNGLQLVRLLRGTWSRHELPILVLTVHDDVHTKVLSLRQGASDYVTKPVEPEELLARVQAHLHLRAAVEENLGCRMHILEARKRETIGRLFAGMAHDLNTPAQFVADNLVFLQKASSHASELLERARVEMVRLESAAQPGATEFLELWKARQLSYLLAEAPKALAEALSGVLRMAHTVKELEEFAGTHERRWGASDLNRALENTTAVSRQLWASWADVSLQLDPKLPPVDCDVAALKQAFFNILLTLVGSTDAGASAPRRLAGIEIETRSLGGHVEVRFSARGPGLRPPSAALIAGLEATELLDIPADHELALAHSIIVRQHRGRIVAESCSERALTFVVELPLAEPVALRPGSTAPAWQAS